MDTTQIIAEGKSWVDFAFHVFDKIWPLVGTAVGGFLAGWLGVNKPKFMQRSGGE